MNGYAFGGGCELSMAATVRIASESAQFGQPETKLGIIPGYGGTQRLSRLVGKGRALELCLTGRFIKAEEALAWGLVSDVVPQEEILSRAEVCLNSILDMAPLAVASTMAVIHEGFDLPLEQALALEADQFAQLCDTEDKMLGTQAFMAKEAPKFKGN